MKTWHAIVGPLLLFLGATALYLPSVRHGFIYDDDKLIVRAAEPQSVGDVIQVFGQGHWDGLPYYRPVARATMVAQKYVHGDQPGPYHVFNAMLAGVAAVLVYTLIRQPAFSIDRFPAFLGAAIFVAHPIMSSCVYPICSGRETLMPTVFTVAAVTAFLRPGRGCYLLALLMLALALFSKEQAVIVPGLFVLADVFGSSADAPGRNKRAWLQRYFPVLMLWVAYLGIRAAVLGGGHEHKLAAIDYPLRPLLSFVYALQMSFVPFWDLVYEPRSAAWISRWRLLVTAVLVAAIGLAAWRSRGRRGRQILFWLAWSVLALLPTANLLKQEAQFAERYALLFLVAISGIVAQILSRALQRFTAPKLFATAGLLVVFVLATISVHRGTFFANEYVFLKQWVRTDRRYAPPTIRLALYFNNKEQHDLAIRTLNDFIALEPKEAKAYNHRAEIYRKSMNEISKAIRDYTHAIGLDSNYVMAFSNRAVAYMTIGNNAAALADWNRVIKLDPDFVEAYNNRGSLHAARGEFALAIHDFATAIKLKPEHPGAYNNLAWLLATCSDAGIRDGDAAVSHAKKAIELLPEKDKLLGIDTLAAAYAEDRQFNEAVKWQSEAIKLAPDSARAALRSRLELYESGQPFRQ